jgi:hypothetical protein
MTILTSIQTVVLTHKMRYDESRIIKLRTQIEHTEKNTNMYKLCTEIKHLNNQVLSHTSKLHEKTTEIQDDIV